MNLICSNLHYDSFYSVVCLSSFDKQSGGSLLAADETQIIAKAAEPAAASRKLVFISHANPEDNEFVSWLATRLAAAGYEVWADVSRLVGGEAFWRDIGTAIKDDAATVVIVLSRASYKKDGVLDEIALAVGTGRKSQRPSFVIPIRLDDLPYSDFPEQLIRLNAVDFDGNWADGLSRLHDALEKAGVPKEESAPAHAFDQWRSFRLRQSGAVAQVPEQLTSNWLRIVELPAQINFCRFAADSKAVAKALADFGTPIVPLERLGLTFSDAPNIVMDDAPSIGVEHAYEFDLQKFLSGERQTGPEVRRGDASNMLTNLLRQAWEKFAEDRGLLPYQFANSTGWYVPLDLIDGNKVGYVDGTGKRRKKWLVGYSKKRQVNWHFAVTAYATLGDDPHFVFRPQVVFTTDGRTPLDSKAKAARLRRSFCKNWWNDRWYGLLTAFVTYLAGDNEYILLPLGSDKVARVEGRLVSFESQLSIVGDSIPVSDDDENADHDVEADDLDDGKDVFFEDELDEGETA